MLTKYASYAALTKARAMYGKRLTKEDYEAMLSRSSLSQLVTYLKQKQGYQDILRDVNENGIHRMQLENRIRQKHYLDFDSLVRYEVSSGDRFADYIFLSAESDYLLKAISRLRAGRKNEFFLSLPVYLENTLPILWNRYWNIQTYDDLLDAIPNSEFRETLIQLKPDQNHVYPEQIRYENAVSALIYKKMFSEFENLLGKKAEEEIRSMIEIYAALKNVVLLRRLNRVFPLTISEAKEKILPYGKLNDAQIQQILDSNQTDLQKLTVQLGLLRTCNFPCEIEDELPERFRFRRSTHLLHYSQEPATVLLSYLYCAEVELQNVIKIIEGIRYGVSKETLIPLLIF